MQLQLLVHFFTSRKTTFDIQFDVPGEQQEEELSKSSTAGAVVDILLLLLQLLLHLLLVRLVLPDKFRELTVTEE